MSKPFSFLILLVVIFVAGVSSVMFHDNGVPKAITDAEKALVIKTWEQADAQMENVLEKLRQFIERPASESETCPDLANAVHDWMDTVEFVRNEPVFSFPIVEAGEHSRRLFSKIENELGPLISKMIDEIKRRRNKESHDQKLYDLVSEAISREENVLESAPCDQNECHWCRARKAMVDILIDKVRP